MKDTILSKDTICIEIGDDHSYNCTAVAIGRAGENNITQLEITIPEELGGFWAYLDFKKPKGDTFKSPRLDVVNNVIEYDMPAGLLNETGNLEAQLVLQNASGEIWKSTVKKYVVLKSIDATDDIPEQEDFITRAQKLLDMLIISGGGGGSAIIKETVTLYASEWVGETSPYRQVVSIPIATENSMVDLNPTIEQLNIFYNKDLTFVTENDNGIITVYCIGQKPTNDYTMQATITEVFDNG